MRKKFLCFMCLPLLLTYGCSNHLLDNEHINSNQSSNKYEYISDMGSYYENGVALGKEKTFFFDFDTMEKTPLCASPNCSHTSSNCLANIIGNRPIFYNNYVYYFSSNNGGVNETPDGLEFYIDSYLNKASLDSSETEVVTVFHECTPNLQIGNFVLSNNRLFFVGDDLNPQKSTTGALDWGNSGGIHYLCYINLDSGEFTNLGSIYDGDKEYEGAAYSSCANIIGVYNNKMYIRYSFCKDNTKLQSGIVEYTHLNFEYDLETNKLSESNLPPAVYMNDDTYIYFDDADKKLSGNTLNVLKDVDTKSFKLDNQIYECCSFNDKIFIASEGKWFNLSDSSEHSMGKYAGYKTVGFSNDSYILMKGSKAVKLSEDELLALDKE